MRKKLMPEEQPNDHPAFDDLQTGELEKLAILGAARLSIMEDLRQDVQDLGKNVVDLTRSVREAYPTRDEVQRIVTRNRHEQMHRRRIMVVAMLFTILVAIQLKDMHTEACAVVDPSESSGRICDLTFPTHSHGGSEFPTPWHVAGWIVYGTFSLIALIQLERWTDRTNDE